MTGLIVSALKSVLLSFVSEAIFKRVIFEALEEFTEWTDTDFDDAILKMAKDNDTKPKNKKDVE